MFDVIDATHPVNARLFTDIVIDGEQVSPDAVGADIDRNIWTSGGWIGHGFDGIHCFTPEGERIGNVRPPETTSNLVFGGPERNRLMITTSQSSYALQVHTIGGGTMHNLLPVPALWIYVRIARHLPV